MIIFSFETAKWLLIIALTTTGATQEESKLSRHDPQTEVLAWSSFPGLWKGG